MRESLACVLVFLLFYTTDGFTKKLQIHRCVLANGTVSFQEEKCSVDVYSLKPTMSTRPQQVIKKRNKKAKVSQKTTKKAQQKVIKSPRAIKNTQYQTTNSGVLHANVGRYRIEINLPRQWQYFKKVFSNKLYHIKMNNQQAGSKASLMIDFVFPDNKNFSQKEIDDLVQLLGSRFVKKSKESQVNIQNFNVNNGKGAMATFTSQETMPEYRYTTKGVIFKNKWLIQFTLLSNNLQGTSHHNALYSLSQTIKITSS